MVAAAEALKLGMVDSIGTVGDAIALAMRRAKSAASRSVAETPPVVLANGENVAQFVGADGEPPTPENIERFVQEFVQESVDVPASSEEPIETRTDLVDYETERRRRRLRRIESAR